MIGDLRTILRCDKFIINSQFANREDKNNKSMITEETKIKELIPDGYEYKQSISYAASSDVQKIVIDAKKREIKDFDWYVKKYFDKGLELNMAAHVNYRHALLNGVYYILPFEIKIGLFKFICDDLKVDYAATLHYINNFHSGSTCHQAKYHILYAVCPKEFLESLVKS
jgi:hypothetical protein